MFREIRRSEKNLIPVKEEPINVAVNTIHPETEMTIQEAKDFMNMLFK